MSHTPVAVTSAAAPLAAAGAAPLLQPRKKMLLVPARIMYTPSYISPKMYPSQHSSRHRFISKYYRKDEGALKFDYHLKAAIDVRACYCIKDEYLTKHETSTHYVGLDDFDLGSATDELPTQDMQTLLQTHKPDRVINAVWTTYCAQWTEHAPHDGSIESCWKWYNDGVYNNTIEGMPDPRKQTQFVEFLHRFRNKAWEFAAHQIKSINAVNAAWCDDANHEEYVLKGPGKKRKHGVQAPVQG